MYFLTVQQIIEKVSIKQASVLLKLNVDPNNLLIQPGHQCASCEYKLSQENAEIFDGSCEYKLSQENSMFPLIRHVNGCSFVL